MKKIFITSLLLLGGCVSNQEIKTDNFDETYNQALFSEIEKLNQKKDYEEIKVNVVEVKNENDFKDKKITFDFTTQATLNDLLEIFDYYNINVVVDSSISLESSIFINKYNGSLKNLISAIGDNTNLSFEYKNEFMHIKEVKTYSLKVIQDKDIIDNVFSELEKIEDLKNIIKNENAGLFTFDSDFKNYKKVKNVLEEINKNTSLIDINLSLINVELNQSNGNGFDWETLNTSVNIHPEDITEAITETIGLSSGNKLNFVTENISGSLVMNVLNTYGTTETLQSINIKSISGKEATFKTTEITPYIDKVETTANGEYASTGYTTAQTETGLEIKLLPYFDKSLKMVNVKVELNKSNLKSFLEINNQDLTISQPQTEEQSFNSIVRLKAGQSNVIGGIIYYKETKTGNNIFNEFTQSNKTEVSKNALFIIIKPTVITYN